MDKEALKTKRAIRFAGTTVILILFLAINMATHAAGEVTITSTYYCNDGNVIHNSFLEDMNYEWNVILHQEILAGDSQGIPADCNLGHAQESVQLQSSEGTTRIEIDIQGSRKESTKEDMSYVMGFAAGSTNDNIVAKWALQNSGQSTVECSDSKTISAKDMLIQLDKMTYTGSVTAEPSGFDLYARGQKTDLKEDVDTGIVHSAQIHRAVDWGQIDSTAASKDRMPEIPTQSVFLLHSDATSRVNGPTEVSVEIPVVAGDRLTEVNMVGSSREMEAQKKELRVNYYNIKKMDSMRGMGDAIESGVSFVPKMTFRI